MFTVEQIVEKFQIFRGKTNINSVIGALLLQLTENNSGNSSSNNLVGTPNLIIATASGTITAGAKYAKFTIYPDTQGSILGTTITSELETVEFPFNKDGYTEIPYTITQGTIVITLVTS